MVRILLFYLKLHLIIFASFLSCQEKYLNWKNIYEQRQSFSISCNFHQGLVLLCEEPGSGTLKQVQSYPGNVAQVSFSELQPDEFSFSWKLLDLKISPILVLCIYHTHGKPARLIIWKIVEIFEDVFRSHCFCFISLLFPERSQPPTHHFNILACIYIPIPPYLFFGISTPLLYEK